MISRLTSSPRLMTAGALIAPILVVQLVRIGFGPGAGPAMSTAAVGMPDASVQSTEAAQKPSAPLTAQDRTVAAWIAKLQRPDAIKSPMEFIPAPESVAATQEPVEVPRVQISQGDTTIPVAMRVPVDLTLGAIMGSSDSALALIGGKVRRVGDTIYPGWTITSINPREQTVTITGPEDAVINLSSPLRAKPNP
ncbi:MAG: hypothetical protein K2X32_11150 [Phycisphaerales bacterium]|nr:hypothetical protein [Phycisphaerales bacterium]